MQKLIDLLSGGDIVKTQNRMRSIVSVLGTSSQAVAKLAVIESNKAADVALDGGHCAEAYTAIVRAQEAVQLTELMVGACLESIELLIEAMPSDAEDAHREHLRDSTEIEISVALIDAAVLRLDTVNGARNDDGPPGSRFDPTALERNDDAEPG